MESLNTKERKKEQEAFKLELDKIRKENPQLYNYVSFESKTERLERMQSIQENLFMLNIEFAILQDNHSLIRILKKNYKKTGKDFNKIFSLCEKKLLKRKNPERELNAQIELNEIAIGNFNVIG